MVNFEKGDIFDHLSNYDVFIHLCNPFHIMNGGVARGVKKHLPELVAVDSLYQIEPDSMLGTISVAAMHGIIGVNIYAMAEMNHGWNKTKSKDVIDYESLEDALMACGYLYKGKSVCMPKIGSLRAGGDWERIKHIIDDTLGKRCNVTIYEI